MTKAPKETPAQKEPAKKKPAKKAAKPKAPQVVGGLTPSLLTTPFELGAVGPGGFIYYRDKLYLSGRDKIFSAAPEAKGWAIHYDLPREPLPPELGEAAEKMGLVQDGAGAAAMGQEMPLAHGMGPFCLFQPEGADTPGLYIGKRALAGGEIMGSPDGTEFTSVSTRGLGDADRLAFNNLVAAGGWLITAPGPMQPRDRKVAALNANDPVQVYASRNPAPDTWVEVALPGLGQGATGGVTQMGVAHGHVYLAVEGADRGFSLWRAAPAAEAPWDWQLVIDRGAYRYSLAPQVTRMLDYRGDLYVATALSDTGFGKDKAGPAAAELLRVAPDGTWDLIMGQPRFSPDGLKVPLSGYGEGFGDGWATMIPSLGEHQGVLYVGLRHAQAEYQYYLADPEGERVQLQGGAALWASPDGLDWTPVLRHGAGNPALVAVRGLVSGPGGLYAALSANASLVAYDAGMEVQPGADDEVQMWVGQ